MLEKEQMKNVVLEDEACNLKKALQEEKEGSVALKTQLKTQQEEIEALKASIVEEAAQVCTPDFTHLFSSPEASDSQRHAEMNIE